MDLMTADRPCSFIRRLAAIGYDAILLFSVWCAATIPVLALRGGRAIHPEERWFPVYLAAIAYVYFAWQWQRGGQTLGMKAWRVRLYGRDGGRVSWSAASLRFFASLVSLAGVGLGFLWCLLNRNSLAWHDYWSGTRLMVLPAPPTGVGGDASGDPTQQQEAGTNHQQGGRKDTDRGA